MKVYVGTYSKYNSGSLKGDWLDIEGYVDQEDFLTACAKLHEDEDDAEFMFQDQEGIPGCFFCESQIDKELWDMIKEADDLDEAIAYVDYHNEWDKGKFDESKRGKWGSDKEFIQDLIDNTETIPEWLEGYIDWDAMTKEYMDDFVESNGYYFLTL